MNRMSPIDPAISVIIPTHNRASLLRGSLESLCEQTLPEQDFEVIVVDDGSTDDTRDVCQSFANRVQLQYLRIANSGIAAAKNMGLFASSGEISYFFDDDDVADPNLLATHLAAHREYSDDRIAVLGYTTWHPDLEVTPLMDYVTGVGQYLFSYRTLLSDATLDFTHFWGGRASAKRAFLVHHGIFNQEFRFGYEDIELGFRLSRHGFRVAYRRDAASYMVRPIGFADFCARCERQGRSLLRLARLHSERTIQDYCRIAQILDQAATAPHLADLASDIAGREARAEDLDALHALYGEAFTVAVANGIIAAAAEERLELNGAFGSEEESLHNVRHATRPTPPTGGVMTEQTAIHVSTRPIFIIGSPRSGTSILAWALNEHSALRALPESDFLYYLFEERDHLQRVYELTRSRPEHTFLSTERVNWEEFLKHIGCGINALFTSRTGGQRWIDQTPLYTLMLDTLSHMFPDSQFVHILRDGRRVVASMLRFAEKVANDPDAERYIEEKLRFVGVSDPLGWTRDVRPAAQTWAHFVRTAREFEKRHPDRVRTVKNEEILQTPVEAFADLAAFFGVKDEPAAAHFFATRRLNSSFGPDGSPAPSLDECPWLEWSDSERGVFAEEAGDVMCEEGYWTGHERDLWSGRTVTPTNVSDAAVSALS